MSRNATPDVTVIIPAYNGEDYVCDAINSVLSQSYRSFELIVVDDGSTDKTRDAIDEFIRSLRISYVHQENGGQAAARNTRHRRAKGKYICFLDQDDLYEEHSLARRVNFLENHHDVGLVCSDFREAFMSEGGTELNFIENYVDKFNFVRGIPSACVDSDNKEACIFNQGVYAEFVALGCFVWIGTAMIRKSLMMSECSMKSYDGRQIMIFSFELRKATRSAFLRLSTAIYRRHGQKHVAGFRETVRRRNSHLHKVLGPVLGH